MASTGPPPPTTQSSGQREMMYCHECNDEWYRDEHGIICPQCDSEFTEVIEEGNDPRDNIMHIEHDDDDDSMPDLEAAPHHMHPLHDHNPWSADDPDDSDISTMRFQPVGPGRFHVSATIHRTVSPTAFGVGGNGPNTIGGITSFLTNLLQGQGQRPPGQPQSPTSDGEEEPGSRATPNGQPHVHRFTYTAGARLHPRDGDNPGPRIEPVDDLNSVLSGLFAAFAEPPGARPGGPGQGHTHAFDEMPMNPLMGLFAAMSGGQHGDFVYSQEALDRIITQLMEQTASSNAPGPAPQEAINALPKRKITEDMLGAEGRVECSICMDEVNIGEEVTELPCKHWFHHACVEAWLHEHNTCPHCRKGITKHEEIGGNTAPNPNATSGADPTSTMPGSFVAGDGSPNSPYRMAGTAPQSAVPHSDPAHASQAEGGAAEGSSGGGVGERFRRGWSDPPQ